MTPNKKSNHFALSVLGKDRPGIISAISKVLYETGCNIEDSSMTLLRNEFIMILIISSPLELSKQKLQKSLKSVANRLGLSILLREITYEEDIIKKPVGDIYVITVYGSDKPGIVYNITSYLAKNNINITDVQTNITDSKDGKIYCMILEVDLPHSINKNYIFKKLKSIADKLKVNISINDIESPSL